jgi:hypothetical protein
MAYVVASANLDETFSCLSTGEGFPALMRCELELAAEANAAGLRPLPAFVGSRSDQLAFEFGEAAEDGEHQSPMGGSGISPSIC